MKHDGKIALVTGASRGIGRAIALQLAKEGAEIILNYRRSKTECESVLQEIADLGGSGIAIRADVGNEDKTDAMFEVIQSEFGKLDILIANASFGIPGNILDATNRYWDMTFNATSRSIFQCALRASELMPQGGNIVTVTSYGGQRVLKGYGVVGPAKAAVEGLTRSLAVELAPKNIVVNGVMPGITDTKSFRAINNADHILTSVQDMTPAGRLVTPDDVANVVDFLCTPSAAMIVGQFIIVDGGAFIMG
ncbi:MAG: SDR family oxidoreductase [Candidatus Marinamargulisbacteria bacterium]